MNPAWNSAGHFGTVNGHNVNVSFIILIRMYLQKNAKVIISQFKFDNIA